MTTQNLGRADAALLARAQHVLAINSKLNDDLLHAAHAVHEIMSHIHHVSQRQLALVKSLEREVAAISPELGRTLFPNNVDELLALAAGIAAVSGDEHA